MHALDESHQWCEYVLLVILWLCFGMCNKLHTIKLDKLFLYILMILSLFENKTNNLLSPTLEYTTYFYLNKYLL